MRHLEHRLHALYAEALEGGTRRFPFEYYYDVLRQEDLAEHYQRPAEDSWMLAAMQRDLPIYTPGWEDSTQGNMFTAWAMQQGLENHGQVVKLGTEAMVHLVHWYRDNCNLPGHEGSTPGGPSVGFFQVGGGIAGDFPICAVPLMIQDLKWDDTPVLGLFRAGLRRPDELRRLQRRGAEREDHLGQAHRRHAQVHDPKRRDDRDAVGVWLRVGRLKPRRKASRWPLAAGRWLKAGARCCR